MHRKDLNFIDNSKSSFREIKSEEKPEKLKKNKLFFLLLVFLFLFISFFSVKAIVNRNSDYLDYDPVTLEPKEPEGLLKKISYLIFNKSTKLEGTKKDRVNILLLGQGGLGHEGPYLTDTIMILSYQPSTNNIALVSIPRDLGVDIPDYGLAKINHANHVGEMKKQDMGGAMATQIISETFDIDIPYYLRIDFKAFTEIIDEIGGVRIDVKRSFTDSEYPTQNFGYKTISFETGWQTMDGGTALEYARSRHGNNGEGSDFARAARQQQIILAVKDKILSFSTLTNPVKLKKMLDTVEENMITNMNFEEILEFVKIAKNLDTENVYNLVLDDSPNGFLTSTIADNGAFLLLPKTGNWDDINLAIKNIFEESYRGGSNLVGEVENITEQETQKQTDEKEEEINELNKDDLVLEIQNGTWQAGLAAQTKQKLIEENFYVDSIGNTDPDLKPLKKSTIYFLNKDISENVKNELTDILNFDIKENLADDSLIPTENTDILIIIGNDYLN